MTTRPLAVSLARLGKRVSPVVERYPRKTETLTELAGEFGELVLAGRLVIRGWPMRKETDKTGRIPL